MRLSKTRSKNNGCRNSCQKQWLSKRVPKSTVAQSRAKNKVYQIVAKRGWQKVIVSKRGVAGMRVKTEAFQNSVSKVSLSETCAKTRECRILCQIPSCQKPRLNSPQSKGGPKGHDQKLSHSNHEQKATVSKCPHPCPLGKKAT